MKIHAQSHAAVIVVALMMVIGAALGCRKVSRVDDAKDSGDTLASDGGTTAANTTKRIDDDSQQVLDAGPLGPSASRAEREDAVLALVRGGGNGWHLPERSTEPTRDFDMSLRDKIAPTEPVLIRSGKVTAEGGLSEEVVARILRQNLGRIRICYEERLEAKPNLKGSLVLSFVIQQDGTLVTTADRTSKIDDEVFVACVIRSFIVVELPKPDGGAAKARYTIDFGAVPPSAP